MNQMSLPDLVATDLADGVITITLGNGKAHPLSQPMIRALHDVINAANENPDARVIVIDGPGHIFCAGHDLKEIARHRTDADDGHAYLTELFEDCAAMMQAVTYSPKPTIAQVGGIATAAGLQLVAACDMAFASHDASFCLPGVNNGGFCTTPAVAVSRAVGRKHLMELLLSGAVKSADWGLRAGLVNEVTGPDQLAPRTRDFATTLASRNPGPIADGKSITMRHLDMDLPSAYDEATRVMIGHFMDPDRIAHEKASRWNS
ncbi:enoyl-CoA hydratase-related protein [Alisedimentitalea sp. MJ-SS2]|uniref:enoyl-CoA hydratase-related protein n=1 Tax=Aliisedimentitalea sp. MJ-SS2 TaxID=3049795 RepID=UPI002909193E|nr:enoyl-CoA hydratase-related protein [Alisedimentitalea sp. MJ-SS2]MDU8926716.1 enoyl-CoA hydratase-related protein [Alisedimentitalea sp. MJ-SS2]